VTARGQSVLSLHCTHCRQTGSAVWEDSAAPAPGRGRQRKLMHLSEGFHSETGRTFSKDPLIVCDRCDQIQGE